LNYISKNVTKKIDKLSIPFVYLFSYFVIFLFYVIRGPPPLPVVLNFTQSRIKNLDFMITHQNLDFTIYFQETKFLSKSRKLFIYKFEIFYAHKGILPWN